MKTYIKLLVLIVVVLSIYCITQFVQNTGNHFIKTNLIREDYRTTKFIMSEDLIIFDTYDYYDNSYDSHIVSRNYQILYNLPDNHTFTSSARKLNKDKYLITQNSTFNNSKPCILELNIANRKSKQSIYKAEEHDLICNLEVMNNFVYALVLSYEGIDNYHYSLLKQINIIAQDLNKNNNDKDVDSQPTVEMQYIPNTNRNLTSLGYTASSIYNGNVYYGFHYVDSNTIDIIKINTSTNNSSQFASVIVPENVFQYVFDNNLYMFCVSNEGVLYFQRVKENVYADPVVVYRANVKGFYDGYVYDHKQDRNIICYNSYTNQVICTDGDNIVFICIDSGAKNKLYSYKVDKRQEILHIDTGKNGKVYLLLEGQKGFRSIVEIVE